MELSAANLGYRELQWLLGSLCNLSRITFDPKLIEQEFPPPHGWPIFHAAARALGFTTGQGAMATKPTSVSAAAGYLVGSDSG